MRVDAELSADEEGYRPSARRPVPIDSDVLEWFLERARGSGHEDTASLVNAALREHIRRADEPLERTLRRVLREELRKVG
jgi:uncharacterized protein (DUF4415 family)